MAPSKPPVFDQPVISRTCAMVMPVVLAFSITAAILVPLRSAFGACANQQRAARGPLASPSAVADQPSVVIRVRCYEGKRRALYRNPELENTICQQRTPAGAVTQTAQLLLQGALSVCFLILRAPGRYDFAARTACSRKRPALGDGLLVPPGDQAAFLVHACRARRRGRSSSRPPEALVLRTCVTPSIASPSHRGEAEIASSGRAHPRSE